MNVMPFRTILLLLATLSLSAQAQTGALDFRVTTTGNVPVAGAKVTVEGPNAKTYTGATERDGHFRLTNLAPGVYHFAAFDAPGYVRAPRNFLADVTIHEGHTREFLFELQPTAKVQGTVFDEQGVPLAGARVVAYRPGIDTLSGEATTDTNGFYLMTLNASPDSFLSTFALPVLVVTGNIQRNSNDVTVNRKDGQPSTIEFPLPSLPMGTLENLNVHLLPAPAPIR
jgi:hypothetical protein